MQTRRKQRNDTELWETRKLGASAEHAKPAPVEDDDAIDASLGLQSISIRLQKVLIDDLKQLAKEDGIGYQPLMRQILSRYVRERKGIAGSRR